MGRHDKVVALADVSLSNNSDFYPIKKLICFCHNYLNNFRGEFVMIRGPSGGGKTTLLNVIGTIDSATKGDLSKKIIYGKNAKKKLEILGEKINSKSSDQFLSNLRLEKIGFVFQTFNLLATMTAYENVELPMKILGKLSDKLIKKRAIELLTRVGLQDRLDHLVH